MCVLPRPPPVPGCNSEPRPSITMTMWCRTSNSPSKFRSALPIRLYALPACTPTYQRKSTERWLWTKMSTRSTQPNRTTIVDILDTSLLNFMITLYRLWCLLNPNFRFRPNLGQQVTWHLYHYQIYRLHSIHEYCIYDILRPHKSSALWISSCLHISKREGFAAQMNIFRTNVWVIYMFSCKYPRSCICNPALLAWQFWSLRVST